MSKYKSSTSSPLRDRLLSNSPDPVKSSILRDSGAGWNSSSTASSTTPLRITKRDAAPNSDAPFLARRTSSSYKHMSTNNLVSKSPFKSQIPTPSRPVSIDASPGAVPFPTVLPRRVSGEKRARPSSMHEQAENERSFALKRERRQSKGFQGLIEKEPVTKSPFKRTASLEEVPPPPPPKSPPVSAISTISAIPAAQPSPRSSTPTRSSLVSRRLHGPRSVEQLSISSRDGKRQRRKTVTFDERCDVVEFDREEGEDDPFYSEEDLDGDQDCSLEEIGDSGEPLASLDTHQHHSQSDDSFESVQLGDVDGSSNLAVENVLSATKAFVDPSIPSTPPLNPSLPLELETEDGVPYGRTHHAERLAAAHQQQRSNGSPAMLDRPEFPFRTPEERPVTPPRLGVTAISSVSPGTLVPLGRSTHVERFREKRNADAEDDVGMLPPSPSPLKRLSNGHEANRNSLIPKFELQLPEGHDILHSGNEGSSAPDPFVLPLNTEDSQLLDASFMSNESLDPANLSIGHSEVSITNLEMELAMELGVEPMRHHIENDQQDDEHSDVEKAGPLRSLNSYSISTSPDGRAGPSSQRSDQQESTSPTPRISDVNRMESPLLDEVADRSSFSVSQVSCGGSPSPININERFSLPPSRQNSPTVRIGSPSYGLNSRASPDSTNGSLNGRAPRISRNEVQKRLLRKRSTDSPSGETQVTDGRSVMHENVGRAMQRSAEGLSGNQLVDEQDEEQDRKIESMSVMTDTSAEVATIQTAEKRTLDMHSMNRYQNPSHDGVLSIDPNPQPIDPPRPSIPSRAYSTSDVLNGVEFDFGGAFGISIGAANGSPGEVRLGNVKSALDRLMDDVQGSASSKGKSVERDDFSVYPGHRAIRERESADNSKSELSGIDDSFRTETDMEEEDVGELSTHKSNNPGHLRNAPANIDSFSPPSFASPTSPTHSQSRDASLSSIPPPVPPKDAIRSREELILEKRREARRREEQQSPAYYTPPRASTSGKVGRPSRRRSMSTGDADDLLASRSRRSKQDDNDGLLLDVGFSDSEEDHLADSISRELDKFESVKKSKYRVREHECTIYASSDAQISHMDNVGDINEGKAWKAVRRPSDMNEYSKQIKELRAQDKSGKAHGKVFVRVLGVKNLNVPLPQQPTALTCTLNNGIHYVTTPECRLGREARIDQEFELIEHSKLEFTLTLKIRRDPHIIAQYKALTQPPPRIQQPAPAPTPPPPSKGGMRSFFSSPKKPAKVAPRPIPPPAVQAPKLPETLARYLKPDGILARAFVSFQDVAERCDTKLFESSYPLIGHKLESGGRMSTLEVGEIVLQIFRLPSLPGVPLDQLPQSLEECHRGLRHVNWHKATYFEGTLTQNGGDCTTWRRRQLRVIGANLVAFNDVTKKATATINLKKAIAVVDDDEARMQALSPAAQILGPSSRYNTDYDGINGVERSFRLIFPQKQEIVFFADTNEEKAKWLEVLRALVGHIPPNPLWAEILWLQQQELAKSTATSARQELPGALRPSRIPRELSNGHR